MDIEQIRQEIALLEQSIPTLKDAWEKALAFQVRTKSKYGRTHVDSQAFDNSLKKISETHTRYENARKKLENLKTRLAKMESGEITTPVQVQSLMEKRKILEAQTAQYMSSILKVGDSIYVYGTRAEVKKVNKKTVVVNHPRFGESKYNYIDEVRLDDNGTPMSYDKQIMTIRQYFADKSTER